MTIKADLADLLAWRMHALGLSSPLLSTPSDDKAADVATVAGHLLAVQGQDWWGGRAALGLRAKGATLKDVHEAFNQGLLVRSWPVRGTIHLLQAQDIGWLQKTTNHRVLPGAVKRRASLGLPEETLNRMRDLTIEALSGGGPLSRQQLSDYWHQGGVDIQGSWRYHVVWYLSQIGLITFGPTVAGGEPHAVLVDEWISQPRILDGDEALAELATRFVAGRGPVTVKDLAWWSGLTIRESRAAIALATMDGRLVPIVVEGLEYWAEPALLDLRPKPPSGLQLLPPFDEHLLGYTDRSLVLAAEHRERIVPGRNGMFLATVTRDGLVVGTWKRKALARQMQIIVTLFAGHSLNLSELAAPAEAIGRFLGVDVEVLMQE